MFATINSQTFTFFPTKAQADALAAANQVEDADAEYRVIENASGKFFVAVFENGEQIGTL